MPYRVGVTCKGCGEKVEVEDEYIPGIRAKDLAATLYQPISGRIVDFVNREWRKTLICENRDCRQTHEYMCSDLRVYNDHLSE